MEATLNFTYSGQNGTLPDPVDFDAPDSQILGWAVEAIRTGGFPGITAAPDANLTDFVIDRFPAKDGLPARLVGRPKVPFGYKNTLSR